MAANPIFIGSIKNCVAQLVNSSGTGLVTVLTPGASGSRLKSLNFASDDTSTRVLQLWVSKGGTDYLLGEISVTLGAGSDGATLPIKGLDPAKLPSLQADGVNYFLDLEAGAVLKVKAKVAVTAAKTIHVFGEYGDL